MEPSDDMDMAAETRLQRACDGCRSRKIRCDRAFPCSNCKTSKLTCTTTTPSNKPQKQRVHISDEYERKIDRIEDRLAGIENVLEALSHKLGALDLKKDFAQSPHPRMVKNPSHHNPRSGTDTNASTPAPFEGETTINRQSEFARELLAQAVGSTPSIEQNAEIKVALTSLQEMVTRQGANNSIAISSTYPFSDRSLVDLDHTTLERPPWDMVNEIIDKASVHPTMTFVVVFPFLKMPNMKEVFRTAFDSPAECGVGRRMLVYGVLTNLFYEFASYPVVDKRNETYRGMAFKCERQLQCAMAQLDLYLPATYENVLAVLLGAAQAIEMCKPSLCWTMCSTAAHLAQNLGYHRIETMKDDTESERNAKIHVFWFIYMMDKTLSLRLGRASIIQDWDMSLPYPNIDADHARFGSLVQQGYKGTNMLLYWIKTAQVQSKAYEKLFSPAGISRPLEERAQTATDLVDALNQAWSDRGETVKLDFPGSLKNIGDIFFHADVVAHHSTCALIQRAVSPDNVSFNEACLESSRAALVAHQHCAQQFNVKGNEDLWTGYINWAVLQAPFTPFIVIFCHAVLHCDPADLNSLSDFVATLESCRTISEGADKLYKMCNLFLQVAKIYVEAKTKESRASNSMLSQSDGTSLYNPGPNDVGVILNTATQFDPYLSALGLISNGPWPMPGFSPMGMEADVFARAGPDASMAPNMQPGTAANAQDWFSGSRYLMNLMEDDTRMPDFNM